jgi:uncharacterized protein (TIGR00369 family)
VASEAGPKSLDREHELLLRSSFAQQEFLRYLGAELLEFGPGFCALRVPYRSELRQQHGYFHAGVCGTIADAACGYAVATLLPKGASATALLTVEYKLNLLAPAAGQFLLTRAQVIRAGKTLKVCRADVFSVKDGAETLCATSLSTIMTRLERGDRPAS